MDTIAVVSTSLLLVAPLCCLSIVCPALSSWYSVCVVVPLSKRKKKKSKPIRQTTTTTSRHGRVTAWEHQKKAMIERSPTTCGDHRMVPLGTWLLHRSGHTRDGQYEGGRYVALVLLSLRSGCFCFCLIFFAVNTSRVALQVNETYHTSIATVICGIVYAPLRLPFPPSSVGI